MVKQSDSKKVVKNKTSSTKKTKNKKNLSFIILGMNIKGKPKKGLKRFDKFIYSYFLPKKSLILFFAKKQFRLLTNVLETVRRVVSKKVKKKKGLIIITIKPSVLITKKPKEVRMGKGKGPVKLLALCILLGFGLVEVVKFYIPIDILCAFLKAGKKLSFKTSIGSF